MKILLLSFFLTLPQKIFPDYFPEISNLVNIIHLNIHFFNIKNLLFTNQNICKKFLLFLTLLFIITFTFFKKSIKKFQKIILATQKV